MKAIRNEFSWSKSRDEVFRECPRQYYFNYYRYWGGWEKAAPERTRQIYILKKLKNRYMWAGERVHESIKHTIRNLQRGISVLGAERIVSITLDQMREEFRSSREKRYSPPKIIDTQRQTIVGNPDPNHISTSCAERQNLTMRMAMRRFTRLTNGFSKKVENLSHTVSLHFIYYNFARIHRTLRVAPAMEIGATNHLWSLKEIVKLIQY